MIGWASGARLAARGHAWILDRAEPGADCTALHLVRETAPGTKLALLSPFDRIAPLQERRFVSVVPVRRWYRLVRQLAAGCDPAGSLKSLASAQIDLLPHQLEPALAVFSHGVTRILIADGVGLGKTVQAGLIAAEHMRRAASTRALILVPAGLREQWTRELARLFGLECISADASWLKVTTADRPSGVNPWALPGTYLASIDFVKQPEALRPLEEVRWDLVVLDEAHTASAQSDRRVAAHAVASRSRIVVLLTATPRTDDPVEHEALCGIGRIDAREGPVLLFRRSQRDIGGRPDRRSTLLFVRPSDAELRMHRLLEEYTRRVWQESAVRGDELATLAAIVLRKRALSSAASLAASVKRRIDLLVAPTPALSEQLRLPIWEEEPLADAEPDGALAAPGLANAAMERRWLGLIAEAAQHAAGTESKTRFIRRMLRRIHEPVIIFTEYRDTLSRLKQALSGAKHAVLLLHGGMRPSDRSRVQREFNNVPDPESRQHTPVLIATDAAAEGLNLHMRCRMVVHYELPWSTARLEQRAGRVDRLGQQRRVHEAGLVATTGAERLVLGPLMRRVARARATGHGAKGLPEALAESHVAAMIMGADAVPASLWSAPAPAARSAVTYTLNLADAAQAEATRVGGSRQLLVGLKETQARLQDCPVASVIRRLSSKLTPGFVVVDLLRLSTRRGEVIHEEPVVWQVPGSLGRGKRPDREVRALVEDLRRRTNESRDALIAYRLGCALDRSVPIHRAVETAWTQRTRFLIGALHAGSKQLVQQGLFERRPSVQPAGTQLETLLARADDEPENSHWLSVDVRFGAVLLVVER